MFLAGYFGDNNQPETITFGKDANTITLNSVSEADIFFVKYAPEDETNINIIEDKFSIYPNPSSGVFTVVGEGIEKIEIVNIHGQILKQDIIISNRTTIDLSTQSKGIYIVKLRSQEKMYHQQIIIQ